MAGTSDHGETTDHPRKYQVFISSTFRDLADARRTVLDVVINRGHLPIALERFPAEDAAVRQVIQRTIEATQIFVVIVGYRYGAVEPTRGISYSHLEYEIAYNAGCVIVPFVLDDAEVAERRMKLQHELDKANFDLARTATGCLEFETLQKLVAELSSELSKAKQLRDFRAEVTGGRFYKPFSLEQGRQTRAFSGEMVLEALVQAEATAQKRKVPGWIREPKNRELAETLTTLSEIRFLVDVVGALGAFHRLTPRVQDCAEKKEAAAAFFVDRYLRKLKPLVKDEIGLFFESGSTLGYVAEAVAKRLRGEPPVPWIATNNVLAFLMFWLVERFDCSLFPWGPPEQHYGAIFGTLISQLPETTKPCFPPLPLTKDEEDIINRLRDTKYSPTTWGGKTLLLGALSGLQLTPDPSIANCLGPHVGSLRNRLFKRYMYATGLPLVIFMTSDKIDCPVDPERCHFILDQEGEQGLSWARFIRDHPVAFCVGCDNRPEDVDLAARRFTDLGLRVIAAPHRTYQTAFVARNEAFISQFESLIGV